MVYSFPDFLLAREIPFHQTFICNAIPLKLDNFNSQQSVSLNLGDIAELQMNLRKFISIVREQTNQTGTRVIQILGDQV